MKAKPSQEHFQQLYVHEHFRTLAACVCRLGLKNLPHDSWLRTDNSK